MGTLSLKAPLRTDEEKGYTMNTSHKEVVRNNLRGLIMIAPGERVMDPKMGVGIKKFLFEFPTRELKAEISSTIQKQVSRYMSYLKIEDIEFEQQEEKLFMRIRYYISPLGVSDILEIGVRN